MKSFGYAAQTKTSPLTPFHFDRREPGPTDVVVAIDYCGICHSDIHQVRDEWGGSIYPMVPGHEIVGHVTAVGCFRHQIQTRRSRWRRRDRRNLYGLRELQGWRRTLLRQRHGRTPTTPKPTKAT